MKQVITREAGFQGHWVTGDSNICQGQLGTGSAFCPRSGGGSVTLLMLSLIWKSREPSAYKCPITCKDSGLACLLRQNPTGLKKKSKNKNKNKKTLATVHPVEKTDREKAQQSHPKNLLRLRFSLLGAYHQLPFERQSCSGQCWHSVYA